jgi:hypothetical protein
MSNKYGIVEFKEYLSVKAAGTASPVSIKAADLDNNFRRLTPLNPDGFPVFNPSESGLTYQTVDIQVCINGTPKTLRVLGMIIN